MKIFEFTFNSTTIKAVDPNDCGFHFAYFVAGKVSTMHTLDSIECLGKLQRYAQARGTGVRMGKMTAEQVVVEFNKANAELHFVGTVLDPIAEANADVVQVLSRTDSQVLYRLNASTDGNERRVVFYGLMRWNSSDEDPSWYVEVKTNHRLSGKTYLADSKKVEAHMKRWVKEARK